MPRGVNSTRPINNGAAGRAPQARSNSASQLFTNLRGLEDWAHSDLQPLQGVERARARTVDQRHMQAHAQMEARYMKTIAHKAPGADPGELTQQNVAMERLSAEVKAMQEDLSKQADMLRLALSAASNEAIGLKEVRDELDQTKNSVTELAVEVQQKLTAVDIDQSCHPFQVQQAQDSSPPANPHSSPVVRGEHDFAPEPIACASSVTMEPEPEPEPPPHNGAKVEDRRKNIVGETAVSRVEDAPTRAGGALAKLEADREMDQVVLAERKTIVQAHAEAEAPTAPTDESDEAIVGGSPSAKVAATSQKVAPCDGCPQAAINNHTARDVQTTAVAKLSTVANTAPS